jgi:amino acid transporter
MGGSARNNEGMVRSQQGRGNRVQASAEGDDQRLVDLSADLRPLDDDELASLRQVGAHWAAAIGHRGLGGIELPVDPGLHRYPEAAQVDGGGRFAPVGLRTAEATGEVVATEQATQPLTGPGRLLFWARRVVVGHPRDSSAVTHERMRKLVALPVLASDALSSIAYGPEAMLAVLVVAGASALSLSLPIAAAIAVLMVTVGLSYRQTIRAYRSAGGSYIVAGDNLGVVAGLTAGASLMIDYVMTVAVSIASGMQAITSAIPALRPASVLLGVAAIGVLLAGNLRGVREAGAIFAAPTYAYILAVLLLVGVGLVDAAERGFHPSPPPAVRATQAVSLLLILRAFASGATAMTGIEAISNAVPAFQPEPWRNARTTLTWMIALLVTLFAGTVVLTHLDGIVPQSDQTVLSQLAHRHLGGPLYAYVQAATAAVLLLAANTAFNGFPRLLFFMARDGYAPKAFLHMGDRLAFSNGIIALAVVAGVMFVAFGGRTESLIHLYAVSVFLAFTLSQAGMVVHWWRTRQAHWRKSLIVNAAGAVLTALVLVIAAVTKFTAGAWLVIVLLPLIVVICLLIHHHYQHVNDVLRLRPLGPEASGRVALPAPTSTTQPPGAGEPETEESPEQLRHLVVVLVASLHRPTLRALAYAASLGQPVLAVHLSPDQEEAGRFRGYWHAWGDHVRLEIVISPYRAVVAPLARYLQALHQQRPELTLTVIVPETIVSHRRHQLLHTHVAARLGRVLRMQPETVISTIPFHLPS